MESAELIRAIKRVGEIARANGCPEGEPNTMVWLRKRGLIKGEGLPHEMWVRLDALLSDPR